MNAQLQRKTYNITEAASALGVSKPKMYQLCQAKGFPAVRLGARIIIPIDRLDQWLNEQADQGLIKEQK